MKLIFETCRPRQDVLTGELREERFAAHLRDVITETADPVYKDARVFFERTYPTQGLKELLQEALGRLSGVRPTNAPIIRLETSFGGGKTHSLIALYHAATKGPAIRDLLAVFVDEALIPKEPVRQVAGVVGSDLDPVNGLDHGDAVVRTLWGEIAYQIGGRLGYELVRKSDEAMVAPGVQVFERLVGEHPALILIDEFAAFLRKAEGVRVGSSTLAEQSIAFLLSLLSFAAKAERVVVVITLADPRDAFGAETERVHEKLVEAGRILARQERIITPTAEKEIGRLVTHRLFEHVDRSEAAITAEAFSAYYMEQLARQAELPERCGTSDYRHEIEENYPFSPELIHILNRKISTIPDFQRTRGALRLLALAIRRLWEARPRDAYLIQPHHIDLGYDRIVEELTSRLKRPEFRHVIEADIASEVRGTPAHASNVDSALVGAGRPPFARRVATTIFLHSLVLGGPTGAELEDVLLASLVPGDDPTHALKALEALQECAWYLDYDGRRYRFRTEPSLNKLIADEMEHVGRTKPKAELDQRIRQVWRKGVFSPRYFPTEAADVEDDAKEPKLVVIHYDAASITAQQAQEDGPPDLVRKIFEYAGTQEGYRTYKNNVLFLVADSDQVERMIEVARRHYAISRIISDPERMKELGPEQEKKLRKIMEEADLQYRIAITRTYRHLFYPSADAPEKHGKLAYIQLAPQDQGDVERDQTEVVLQALRQVEKVLTADDKTRAPTYIKAKAWPAGKSYVTTAELQRAFAQKIGLPILLDVNQLKRTIRVGCEKGVWYYQAPGENRLYGPPSPPTWVEISDDAILYTPEAAKVTGLPVVGEEPKEERCPVCGQPVKECACGKVCPRCGQDPCVCRVGPFRAEGHPAQAFRQLLDALTDAKVQKIQTLVIQVRGTGAQAANDVRLLGLAIPQLGKAKFTIEQTMSCEFEGKEDFSLHYRGSWDRYREVKPLADAFGKMAKVVHVQMQVRMEFVDEPGSASEQLSVMKDVLVRLGVGKVELQAELAEERG